MKLLLENFKRFLEEASAPYLERGNRNEDHRRAAAADH